jgi:hypothetical protein
VYSPVQGQQTKVKEPSSRDGSSKRRFLTRIRRNLLIQTLIRCIRPKSGQARRSDKTGPSTTPRQPDIRRRDPELISDFTKKYLLHSDIDIESAMTELL